jgi:hypothetical protein
VDVKRLVCWIAEPGSVVPASVRGVCLAWSSVCGRRPGWQNTGMLAAILVSRWHDAGSWHSFSVVRFWTRDQNRTIFDLFAYGKRPEADRFSDLLSWFRDNKKPGGWSTLPASAHRQNEICFSSSTRLRSICRRCRNSFAASTAITQA